MKKHVQTIKHHITSSSNNIKKHIKDNKVGLFGVGIALFLLGFFMVSFAPQTFAASGDSYVLVTSESNLAVGDQVIIVASDYNDAMSTTQNGNNRGQTAITKSGTSIAWVSDLQVLTLVAGLEAGTFAFKTETGYLYAAASSANRLRTETTISVNSSRTINIAGSNTSIVAKGTNRRVMQYNLNNPNTPLFACYVTASQKPISIYKLATNTPPIATINLASGQLALTTSLTNKFLVTFSKPINTSTFACDDITFAGTAAGTCTNIQQISPNNGTRFEVITTASNDGTMSIDIGIGKLADTLGTLNGTTIINSNTITIDTTIPIATIDLASGQNSSTTLFTGKFLITFSEAINTTTFDCSDINLSGTAPGKNCVSIQQIAPNDGTTFEVVTSASNDGTISINIGTGKLTDTIGTVNGTTIITNNTITIDRSSLWLSPGDIVIVTANGSPDFFEFLVRKDLDPGTVIYFSDNGWNGDNTRRTGEGSLIFTSSTTIPAGTIISVQGIEATPSLIQNTLGTIQKHSNFDIAVGGDNILVYQGDSYNTTTPIFIHGIGFFSTNPRINSGIPTSNNSYLPTSLTLGVNAINYDIDYRNSQYNCVNTAMSSPSFVADVHNKSNWTGNTIATIDGNYPPISCIFHNNTIPTYILMYEAGTGGSLSGDALQEIDEGENGTAVEAIANTGYYFVQRSDGSTTNPRIDVNVSSDIEVIAQFTETLLLIYTAGANGSLSGNELQEIRGGEVGTPVEAIADPGYHFTQRSDGITNNPRTDNEDTYVTAYFVQDAAITYTLEYIAGSNGTISGASSQTIEEHTDGYLVEAIPNPGYHFVQRSDGSTTNPRTDTNITGNMSVTAQFEANPIITYTLNYSTDGNGLLVGTTSQTINEGEDGTPVEAIANNGYHFVQRDDGITSNPRTDVNITGNILVTAQFTEDIIPNNPSHGGGGNSLHVDNCPGGDNSPSYYDGTCEAEIAHGSPENGDNNYSPELNEVYDRAFAHDITTMDTILQADMEGMFIRSHMAKMMVNYTVKILHKETIHTGSDCSFDDTDNETDELKSYITLACQLGLMGQNSDGKSTQDSFNPNGIVTRAEFGTVLSRALYGIQFNGDEPYYEQHLQALKKNNIITNTSPMMQEIRGWAMLMLMRAAK